MYKRIAVHVDRDGAFERRIAAAVGLAQAHNGEVVGVYVQDPPYVYGYNESLTPTAVLEVQRRLINDERQQVQRTFEHLTASAGVPNSWSSVEGLRDVELAVQARSSDILILSQPDADFSRRSSIEPYQLETVIMTAGRPVIVVPYDGGLADPVERVLICWDGGREAAQAVADAAPFLGRAKEIVVLSLDQDLVPRTGNRSAVGGLEAYLRAHGYVAPKAVFGSSDGVGIGNAILNTASDHGADLIVMGLYGHSRAREWILGGASREILATMTVPVLFAH
ncbi:MULTISPECIES: universal stress protein [unclassified Achromobacter]|uniref:universal stress protein n=1 Tax=unclassified Achromobacter TaxID=2626865 RepID=UPI000B51C701|nr:MULTISPECIES: universal stress protein [unclassified Achromobacter]OWT68118.1 universal stress protein [Achromobacter sp. HZ34]OWT69955.1 universal stress protein [Achromobacter sp. HZ28]